MTPETSVVGALIACIVFLAGVIGKMYLQGRKDADSRYADLEKRYAEKVLELEQWKALALKGLKGMQRGVVTAEVALLAGKQNGDPES